MVKSEIKEISLLLIFTFLLSDILTGTTVGFVALGSVLVWLKIRPSKLMRNMFALGLFASYWITYGKVIDPETGLNFLTSIVVLKLLEKETRRDQYMIFFGLLLLISSGSLFERTLTYVIFFSLSFLILIQDFYRTLGLPWKIKDIRNAILWVVPLTGVMFFLTPRLLNPLPYQGGKPSPGEVGYTPDVNISEIERLEGNDRPVFQALLNKKIYQHDLYWRGNTISFTDGWNWTSMPHDQDTVEPELYQIKHIETDFIHQSVRVYNKEDYFFTLDRPQDIYAGNGTYHLKGKRTLAQKRWQWFNRYEAISSPRDELINSEELHKYLRPAVSKRDQQWIDENFKGKTLSEVRQELQEYLVKHEFQYSLNPGRVQNFHEFMVRKKIGYCSHYSSALAIILRQKKIPSRLVSGFMGGNFNRFADSYLVTQNDAHVWVEALENNSWVRLDPTEWIAPDRVQLGGEAFMSKVASQGGIRLFPYLTSQLGWFNDLKQWFGQWDFKFYQWMEEMDYYGQDALLAKLRFERKWFLTLAPILIALFLGLYAWHVSRTSDKLKSTPLDEAWDIFRRKLFKKGIQIQLVSVSEIETQLQAIEHPEKEGILEIWNELVKVSFKEDAADMKGLLKKLKGL